LHPQGREAVVYVQPSDARGVSPFVSPGRIQLELTASYGPMAAGEVVLSGGGLDELVTAGTVVMLSIAAAHARPLLGNELLAVTVVAPSKVRQGVAVVLGDGARAYTAALPFSEVGRHTVEVQLASESVRGAPFTVDVLAQEFHLPNCIVQVTPCSSPATITFNHDDTPVGNAGISR
jgi:hypothetical protein